VSPAPSDPEPADAIFVFAGMAERKSWALDLWRRGLAPVLILSVGRFEWRRTLALGLPSDGGLRALVEATPPPRRHFFVTLSREGAGAARVERGRLGTWSEARALGGVAAERGYRSILVVSTGFHLRRAALALRRALDPAVRLSFAPVPEERSSIRRDDWWRRPAGCALVLGECVKLPVYALLARRRHPLPPRS
jgi:hypothetical protein